MVDTEPGTGFFVPTIAEEILRPDAPRHEWLRMRRDGIGASDALAVLGLHPYVSPYELWLNKTGQLPDDEDNKHTRRGRILEPAIAEWFTEETGIPVARTGTWARLDNPVWRCNPDRLTADGGGLEIKTVHGQAPTARAWRDEVPEYPEGQAQYSMGVTGAPFWWVAGYTGGSDLYVYRVERDDEVIGELLAAAAEFMRDHVRARVAPPVDALPRTGEAIARALQEVNATVDLGIDGALLKMRRRQLKDQIKQLTTELTQVENEIKAALLAGQGAVGCCGDRPIIRYPLRHNSGYTVAPFSYRELCDPLKEKAPKKTRKTTS